VTADDGRPLRVAVLGPVRAWRGEAELELGASQRRAVLGLLAVRANQVVPRDELIDGLWGEELPASAVNALHVHVSRLRATLEPQRAHRAPSRVLLAAGTGYQLRLAPGQLDAETFADLLAQAGEARAKGDLTTAGARFDAALRLWQGAALAGIPGPSAQIVRAGLGEQRLTAIEERIEVILALGRHAEAAQQLMALVREHPLRERFAGQLMLALYRSGRQAEALNAFADARRVLVGELGIEPGPQLRTLHARILAADPGLEAPLTASAVRLAPATPARPTPAQLPADVAAFTGRSDELAALDLLLTGPAGTADAAGSGGAIFVVSGTAGVGKTALAVRWSRRAAGAFPDGQLYVNLRGYDPGQPVPPGDALAGFLRALGLAGQDIPQETDERAAAYRSLLDGRRVLVVLDNAVSVEQVRPLLPGCPSCLVVVTSRDSLAGLVARHGAGRLDLDMLPLPDALGLLRTLIGGRVDAEPEAAAALAKQCARLPLALRVAAELAAASPGSRLAGLAGELASEQRRLDLLDAGGDERTAVRGVFSWSYRHLPAGAARAFRLLGLHPGPDLDAYALAALTGASATEAGDILALLARAHLVHPAGAGRYGMHDLLRAYASHLTDAEDGTGASPEDADTARARATAGLFDYYLAAAASAMDALVPAERHYRPRIRPAAAGLAMPALTTPAQGRAWLDAERAILVAIAAQGSPGQVTRLAATLFRYLETGGHYTDAMTIHGHARDAARLLGDRAAEATASTNLGIICWRQGRYPQAIDYHQQARAASVEIGDKAGQAIAEANLGVVYERQGRFWQAAESHRLGLALFRETGDQTGEARALANLGSVAARQDHCDEAVACYQQALTLLRQTGDRAGEASALPDLGVAYQRLGRYEQAADCYQQALALFRETGDRIGEAEARNGVAEVLLATGRPDEARAEHAAALALAERIGDTYEQARAHNGLSAALRAVGDTGRADQHQRRALELYPEPLGDLLRL
jgi:DNA-binding SARP family transcriptional activator/Tfp pilus assembly protein PilF